MTSDATPCSATTISSRKMTKPLAFLSPAEYESFDAALIAANQWIKENEIRVVNVETVVLPNIWSRYEEGSRDPSLGDQRRIAQPLAPGDARLVRSGITIVVNRFAVWELSFNAPYPVRVVLRTGPCDSIVRMHVLTAGGTVAAGPTYTDPDQDRRRFCLSRANTSAR